MVKGKYWYDLEGYIRKCVLGLSAENMNILHDFWWINEQAFIFDYILDRDNDYHVYDNPNKKSCAYILLASISSDVPIVSFNYTDPFDKFHLYHDKDRFIRIHGESGNLDETKRPILGIDSKVKGKIAPEIFENEHIKDLIKVFRHDRKEILIQYLKSCDNIVFFGHSLSIVDSDYFDTFFKLICENTIVKKNIYILTKDQKSLNTIKDAMSEYGIDFDMLSLSKSEIIPIYTEKGINNSIFLKMLETIK